MDDKTRIHRPRNLTDNYTIVSNAIINDRRLSYKARGILLYLLSKPADWKCMIANLKTDLDRRTAVMSGLKELREVGYMSYVVRRDPNTKRVAECYYVVYPSPEENDQREPPEGTPPVDNAARKSSNDNGQTPLFENRTAAQAEGDTPLFGNLKAENLKAGKPQAGNRAQQRNDLTKDRFKKTTTAQKAPPAPAAPVPVEPPAADVVVLLESRGIKGKVAIDLASQHERHRIEQAVEHLDLESMRKEIVNPSGWLVACLKGDYRPPAPPANARKFEARNDERKRHLTYTEQGRAHILAVETKIGMLDDAEFRQAAVGIIREATDEYRDLYLSNPSRSNWLLCERVFARLK